MARLASGQHGVFSRVQALKVGADDGWLYRRVRTGRLERVEAGVYRLPGTTSSFHQRILIAILGAGPGTVASHRCAAALIGLDGVDEGIVEVCVPRNRRYERAVTHRSTDLARADVTTVAAIPCTTATRTCVDLGAVVGGEVVERAFECAVRRGLTTPGYAERRARALARPGRAGPGVLLEVLRRRQQAVNGSELETRFEQLCRAAGVSRFRRQFPIGPYVVDYADPAGRVVVELDGLETHSTSHALQHDLSRQNFLVLEGWTVLRFTWDDVTRRRQEVVAMVGEA